MSAARHKDPVRFKSITVMLRGHWHFQVTEPLIVHVSAAQRAAAAAAAARVRERGRILYFDDVTRRSNKEGPLILRYDAKMREAPKTAREVRSVLDDVIAEVEGKT